MKKIAVFSFFGYGHINPILPVVQQLSEMGNSIDFYSITPFKSKIQATGAHFKAYSPKIDYKDLLSGRDMIVFGHKLIKISELAAETILPMIEKDRPDCIIHDGLCLWGKLIASKLNIPAISYVTTFGISRRLIPTYPDVGIPLLFNSIIRPHLVIDTLYRYYRLIHQYKVKDGYMVDMLMNKEDFNIIFTSSVLQPLKKRFVEDYTFVGASIYDRDKTDVMPNIQKGRKKLIYVSLGTIFNDDLPFYQNLVEIFADTPYQVIISLGSRFKTSDLPKIPPNIIVANHVPQLDVLKKTDLFITHGGANSINESIYFGVPMILFPQMLEQRLNAKRIEKLGLGHYFRSTKLSKEQLLATIEEILSNKEYYQKAEKFSETLKKAGGYKKAACLISHYINR